MSLATEGGGYLLAESGAPLLDEARTPKLVFDPMNKTYTLPITDAPASASRSNWTPGRVGVTVVSVLGDWGAATKLSLVYSAVGDDADDTVAPPTGASDQEYAVFAEIAVSDVEQVIRVEPSASIYKLAVIPTGNDATTDLKVVFS